jgi:hypothetical protein
MSEFLHQGGRKLNDQYFIIKARQADARETDVTYHAYSPRTSAQYAVTMSEEELGSILGVSRTLLFSESATDRKVAHQTVIDSLQFEDLMLAQTAVGPPPTAPPAGLDAAVGAEEPAVAGACSPTRLTVAMVEASGTLVLRVGRKINGTGEAQCPAI